MDTLEKIKARLIDYILISENEDLLQELETLLSSSQAGKKLQLNSYQIEMLLMSQEDIARGEMLSEKELEAKDSKWMK